MTTGLSLLLEIGGSYVAAGGDTAEIWNNTVRLTVQASEPADIGVFPTALDVEAFTVARTESDWTIASNWRIDNGTVHFSPDDYLNDQAAPAVIAWLGQNGISLRTVVQYLKLYPIGSPLGRAIAAPGYSQGTPALLTFTGTLPTGGGSNAMLPPQDSVVVSHRTRQTGRKGRGRMYLPPSEPSILDADGKVQNSFTAAMAAAQVTLLEGLAFTGSGPDIWHVRPVVTGKPFTDYGVIFDVACGNIVDTQRRRRNRLTEIYAEAPVSY